jgi:hypothetical protein
MEPKRRILRYINIDFSLLKGGCHVPGFDNYRFCPGGSVCFAQPPADVFRRT